MTSQIAKDIIGSLDLTGFQFSELLGKNKNYVTDFNRYGVPENIAIILELCQLLLKKKASKKEIINILQKQGKTLV